MKRLLVNDFLEAAKAETVVDVRSPAEYAQGHIPGAINLPLFTDTERALVGTLYKQEGKRPAIKKGLEIVGPKLARFITDIEHLPVQNNLLVHCWRGGMRSESMVQLFEAYGIPCALLMGGYKAYRQFSQAILEKPYSFLVITGYTGTGKTEMLAFLKQAGEQVIDLEAMAHHHGSSFGGLLTGNQPSSEHFQNLLVGQLLQLDKSKRIWLEDESFSIGQVHLPVSFFKQKQASLHIMVDVPKKHRIERLVKTYGKVPTERLFEGIEVVKKKLRHHYKECCEALESGNAHKVVELLLTYYDRSYDVGLEKKDQQKLIRLSFSEDQPQKAAEQLLQIIKNHERH